MASASRSSPRAARNSRTRRSSIGRRSELAGTLFDYTRWAERRTLRGVVIFRGSQPDVPLPDVDFSTFVLDKPRRLSDKVALIDAAGERQVTFGELTASVDAIAAGLL